MSSSPDLLPALRGILHKSVVEAVGRASHYVLLDHPTHWNVGDHAIWLGERKLLTHAGLRLSNAASMRSIDWAVLEATNPEHPIVIHGGGNVGDLWPRHQAFREEVIRRFPNRRIVQMPQSVWFESRGSLERARRCFESHPALTVLVRDRRSLEYFRAHFEVPSYLSPDGALSLVLSRPDRPVHDIQTLIRSDLESRLVEQPWPQNLPRDDWLGRGPLPLHTPAGLGQRVASRIRDRQHIPGVARLLSASFDLVSRSHLRRGSDLLSKGRVVITDRLHGHILCLLLVSRVRNASRYWVWWCILGR